MRSAIIKNHLELNFSKHKTWWYLLGWLKFSWFYREWSKFMYLLSTSLICLLISLTIFGIEHQNSMTTLSKHYCKDPILPLYWHRNWLKKTNCDKINAAISFWILPPEVLWSKKISYNSNSWFRRDSKQRVSIISEPVLFIYLSLSYVNCHM